ncbi:MAG: hypothetical protein ACTHKB_15705 [Burkholderiaceae bacterium]
MEGIVPTTRNGKFFFTCHCSGYMDVISVKSTGCGSAKVTLRYRRCRECDQKIRTEQKVGEAEILMPHIYRKPQGVTAPATAQPRKRKGAKPVPALVKPKRAAPSGDVIVGILDEDQARRRAARHAAEERKWLKEMGV